MHPHAVPPNQKGKPWPAYFLVRTTGEVVPLIAVDELPPGTDLVGVPRSLNLEDTIGMLNLGLQRSSGAFYQLVEVDEKHGVENAVKTIKQTTEPSPTAPEHSITHQFSTNPTNPPAPVPPRAPLAHASRAQVPSTTHNPTSHQLPNNHHSQPQTTLCRHWCHHGICKWGQQCRYRHIMPMSQSGLSEVGLADWPLWFRRMNPGYFAAEAVNLNLNQSPGLGGRVGGGGAAAGVRGRRAVKTNVCMSPGGNGGACCGVLHGPGGGVGRVREREREQRDRIRGERVGGRGPGIGRGLRSEELGEKIIARLRGMSKEHTAAKEKGVDVKGDRLSSASVVERAAARDTKNWEDESEDEEGNERAAESEGGVGEKDDVGKGKLVDV